MWENYLTLKPNERPFQILPIGIKYECEYCHEGEMEVINESITFSSEFETPMRKHICSKCNKEMLLPKAYPYIEWIPVDNEKLMGELITYFDTKYEKKNLVSEE